MWQLRLPALKPPSLRGAGRGTRSGAGGGGAGPALGAGEPEGAGLPLRCSAPGVSCELPPRRQGRRQAGSEPARQAAPRRRRGGSAAETMILTRKLGFCPMGEVVAAAARRGAQALRIAASVAERCFGGWCGV